MDKTLLRFFYNGKIYQTGNLDRMLQKLGVTENDIVLIKETPIELEEIVLHHFKNKVNGHTITSVNSDLEDCKDLYNLDDWIKID